MMGDGLRQRGPSLFCDKTAGFRCAVLPSCDGGVDNLDPENVVQASCKRLFMGRHDLQYACGKLRES